MVFYVINLSGKRFEIEKDTGIRTSINHLYAYHSALRSNLEDPDSRGVLEGGGAGEGEGFPSSRQTDKWRAVHTCNIDV